MKKFFTSIMILIMGAVLVSCKKNENTIALLMSNRSNEFFLVLENNFKEKAKELGYKVIVYDAENDASKQPSQVEDAITKGVKAIVINPLNKDATKTVLNDAVKRNIPIVTVDTTVEGVELLADVSTDNYDGGKFAAEWLTKKSGFTPETLAGIVHMKGIDGHTAHIGRYGGFNDYLKSAEAGEAWNEFTLSNKYKEVTGNFAQDVARNAMDDIISSLDKNGTYVVYAENDVMAIGVYESIKNTSGYDIKNFKIIGFDGSAKGKQLVDEGNLAVTVVQDFAFIGQKAALVIDDYLTKQIKPASPTIAVEVQMYKDEENPRK